MATPLLAVVVVLASIAGTLWTLHRQRHGVSWHRPVATVPLVESSTDRSGRRILTPRREQAGSGRRQTD